MLNPTHTAHNMTMQSFQLPNYYNNACQPPCPSERIIEHYIDILRIDFPSYKFIKLRYNKYTITQLMRKAYSAVDSEPNVTITSSSSGWLEH